jgi:hypothetical protein
MHAKQSKSKVSILSTIPSHHCLHSNLESPQGITRRTIHQTGFVSALGKHTVLGACEQWLLPKKRICIACLSSKRPSRFSGQRYGYLILQNLMFSCDSEYPRTMQESKSKGLLPLMESGSLPKEYRLWPMQQGKNCWTNF